MEKSSQRENILLGYSLQRSFTNHSSSPRAPNRDSDDVDFHDVFGGPPRRRSSAHETRYSFSETAGSFALKGGGDNAPPGRSSSWSCLNEIPVFGEDSPHGRRFSSNDFYDDIFKGDESATPPRRHELDIFSSVPGSRVSSPARQLPPPAEPFGSSSLPAELRFFFLQPPFLDLEMGFTPKFYWRMIFLALMNVSFMCIGYLLISCFWFFWFVPA